MGSGAGMTGTAATALWSASAGGHSSQRSSWTLPLGSRPTATVAVTGTGSRPRGWRVVRQSPVSSRARRVMRSRNRGRSSAPTKDTSGLPFTNRWSIPSRATARRLASRITPAGSVTR
jgi:hypothetical protein